MAETEDYDKSATPTAHKTTHQHAGSDELSVLGLSGLLADGQTPLAHKTSHQKSGSDEISVANLTGLLATAQTPAAHKSSHQKSGSDEISVTDLTGLLATPQTPAAHKTSHQGGGGDEISVQGLSGLLADDQHVLDAEVTAVIDAYFQKCRCYAGNAQTITKLTFTKVAIDTDSFDPANISDLTNNRIKPTKPGYYIVVGQAAYSEMNVNASCQARLYKNGSGVAFGLRFATPVAMGTYVLASDLIYFDGVNDYVELWTYHNSGDDEALAIAATTNYLSVVGPF